MKAWHVILIILLTLAICSGCKTVEYVPVETVRIDTTYIYRSSIDTILQRDSIHIVDKGDTVMEYRYKYMYKYRDRIDTLYLNSVDSVQVPYPVEKELSWWKQTKVNYGGYAIGLVIILILIVFGRMVYKLKK